MLLKESKYTEKKVIRYINNNLSDFFSSDESDEDLCFEQGMHTKKCVLFLKLCLQCLKIHQAMFKIH